MRKISVSQLIKLHIRKELNRKEIIKEITKKVAQEESAVHLPNTSNLSQDKIEAQLVPILNVLLNHRIVNDGEAVKLADETGMNIYVRSMVAIFDNEEEIIEIPGQEVTLQSYTEDRWVYVYVNSDRTFTVNKYPPFVGTNIDRVIICKVWVEKNATTYEAGMVRDLRQVGVASANINHILRQVFIHLMHAIPATIIGSISVVPYTYDSGEEPSGGSGLYVQVGSTNDKILYAKLNPIPDTIVEIDKPLDSGDSYNYYIVCSARVDNDDPDDFTWNIKTIRDNQSLEIYEIPIVKIEGITADTTEITVSMIKTIGYQRNVHDYYDYTLEFKYDNETQDAIDKRHTQNTDTKLDNGVVTVDNSDNTIIGDGGIIDYFKISSSGVVRLFGSAKGIITLRPEINVDEIKKQAVPTQVQVGVFFGYSLPIYNNDNEELFFKVTVPRRWDGTTNPTAHILIALSTNESVDESFNFQFSWNHGKCGEAISVDTTDVEVETVLLIGRTSQYDIYTVTFSIDYDIDISCPLEAHDLIAGRLRRIDVGSGSDEVEGEIIVLDWHIHFPTDKIYGND